MNYEGHAVNELDPGIATHVSIVYDKTGDIDEEVESNGSSFKEKLTEGKCDLCEGV